MLKKLLLPVIMLSVFILSVLVGFTQSPETFIFVNETNQDIDETAIRAAAQSFMQEHHAKVAVFFVVSGNATDFTNRLRDAFNGTSPYYLSSNTFALYVATEEQYSELRWGSKFGRIKGDALRSNHLNPMLRERDFTQAIVNTFSGADAQMSNPLNSISTDPDTIFACFPLILFAFIALHQLYRFARDPQGTIESWLSGSTNHRSYNSSYRSSSPSSHRSRVRSSSRSNSRSSGGSSGGSWND